VILPLSGCGNGSSSPSSAPAPARASTSTATPATAPETTSSVPSTNGSATAVLPANFTAAADGSLSPATVAAPASTAIVLTITSKASRPLRVFVVPGRFFTVPAGGRGSVRLDGLKPGRHQIYIEGIPRGTLVVGAAPGP
jgi:hypothetical protein